MNTPGTPEQRVFLHVGAPKTGTTFVQTVLFHHRDQLRQLGVLYPAERYDDHFFAAVDLQDLDFSGEHRPEAAGRWEEVAAQVRAWPGTSVISHDVLAGATPEQAQRAIDSLAPATVHVVCTARDLVHQLPSHWQEDVKHGQCADFDQWYASIMRRDDSQWQFRWFWRVEDIPDVLRRWGSTLPPERVHVVTVPRPGAPADLLWERFAGVVGIGPDDVDLDVVHHQNSALGVAEVELVRRINAAHAHSLPAQRYERDVKGVLAHEVLAVSTRTPPLRLPDRLRAEVTELADDWSRRVRSAGYDIVGDLDDLIPAHAPPGTDSTVVSTEDVIMVAENAVFMLLTRIAECRVQAEQLRVQRDTLSSALAHARSVIDEHQALPPVERIKRTVVEIGRTSRPVGGALSVYRRLRRRV